MNGVVLCRIFHIAVFAAGTLFAIAGPGGALRAQEAPAAGGGDAAEEGEEWDARLVGVEGSVSVFDAERPENGWIPAEQGMPLEAGDKVKTSEDSRAEVVLGPDSVIELGPNTEFELTGLNKKDTFLGLPLGSLFARVRSLLEFGGQMRLQTPQAVAAVRGTEFAAEVTDPEGEAHFAVFDEGRLGVVSRDAEGAREVVLEKNQELSARKGMRELRVRPLERFAKRRGRIEHLRGRREAIRKKWRAMKPERRRELRKQVLERRRKFMQHIRERRKKLEQDRPRHRGPLKTRDGNPGDRPDPRDRKKSDRRPGRRPGP